MVEISGVGDHKVVPYDEGWEHRAGELIHLMQQLIKAAVRVEHVGSTAVPGLAGRPIPDIQVSVPDIYNTETFFPALEGAGYQHFRFAELLVDDYFVFVPADGSNTEHIEICEAGSEQELRHLALRDFLRAHRGEREAYEAVKRAAADAASGSRELYSAGKNAFLAALQDRAIAWYRGRPPARAVADATG